MRKIGQQGGGSYATIPISMRYLGNTGTGEDSAVQPSNPTNMIETTKGRRMLHEDEDIYGDGKQIMVKPSPYTQAQMRRAERNENIPGYQVGTNTPLQLAPIEPITRTAPTFANRTPTASQMVLDPNIGSNTTQTAPTIPTVRNTPLQINPATTLPPAQEVSSTTAVSSPAIATPIGNGPTLEDKSRSTAMGRTLSASKGILPEYDANFKKQLDDLKSTMGVEQQVLAQEGAQTRTSPEITAARQAMGRAGARQTLAEAESAGAIGRGALQQQATDTLASQGLAGQQFEQDKKQYENTQGWQDFEYAAQYGSDADVIDAYKSVTGKELDPNSVAEIRGYARAKRAQDITSGNIELDRLKNAYGDEAWNSIQGMIGDGSSLDQINERLTEQGKNLMSFNDFQSVRGATALGQREWERGLSAASMLLQTNDAKNIVEAEAKLNELFPGVTFDMGQLISDVGSDRFAQSMTDMATISSTFDTWEEAKTSVDGMNLISKLGIDEAKAKEMFIGLKLNVIDEEWKAIEESDWFKALKASDPAAAELVSNTFTAGITGELEFDIQPVYNIVDGSGEFIKSFDNVAEANTYLGENASRGYSVQKKSNYIYKDMGTGDTVTVNNGTGGATSGGEIVETARMAYARLSTTGTKYTEDDIQEYIDEKGTAPQSNGELDTWNETRHEVNYWERLSEENPGYDLTNGGLRPTISLEDVEGLISAREDGDKRADNYFIVPEDLSKMNEAIATYQKRKSVPGEKQLTQFSGIASQYIREATENNVGKIIIVSGKPYIIKGVESITAGSLVGDYEAEGNIKLYNPETKQNIRIEINDIINTGIENIKENQMVKY